MSDKLLAALRRRHSPASALRALGLDQALIDEMLGTTTGGRLARDSQPQAFLARFPSAGRIQADRPPNNRPPTFTAKQTADFFRRFPGVARIGING